MATIRNSCLQSVPSWGAPQSREQTVATDEDNALVERFLRGDSSAFDMLFQKYQVYVYNIIYGIVGSHDEANDLAQDVFLQVHRSLANFRHRSRFATWLYRIAVNKGVDAARSAKRWRFLPFQQEPGCMEPSASEDSQPERIYERKASHETVQKTLMRCPVSHRDILVLRYYQNLSIEEISETLDCSLSAAKVRLHRARKVFRDHFIVISGGDFPFQQDKECGDAANAIL